MSLRRTTASTRALPRRPCQPPRAWQPDVKHTARDSVVATYLGFTVCAPSLPMLTSSTVPNQRATHTTCTEAVATIGPAALSPSEFIYTRTRPRFTTTEGVTRTYRQTSSNERSTSHRTLYVSANTEVVRGCSTKSYTEPSLGRQLTPGAGDD